MTTLCWHEAIQALRSGKAKMVLFNDSIGLVRVRLRNSKLEFNSLPSGPWFECDLNNIIFDLTSTFTIIDPPQEKTLEEKVEESTRRIYGTTAPDFDKLSCKAIAREIHRLLEEHEKAKH